MAELLTVMIDLTEAGLGSDRDKVEARSLTLADELRAGNLAESAKLVREETVREGAKSAGLAFTWGLLTAEISTDRIPQVLGFLANRFSGRKVLLTYKIGDAEITAEHGNQADIDRAMQLIDRFEQVSIRVAQARRTEGETTQPD